jgi:hypothetical protein
MAVPNDGRCALDLGRDSNGLSMMADACRALPFWLMLESSDLNSLISAVRKVSQFGGTANGCYRDHSGRSTGSATPAAMRRKRPFATLIEPLRSNQPEIR